MVAPLIILSTSLGIASSSISGIVSVWNFIKVCEEIRNSPENAQVFIRLLKQVKEDFDYAVTLRSTIQQRARKQQRTSSFQDEWIYRVLLGTAEELHDFGRHVSQYDREQFDDAQVTENFKAKVRFALKDSESLKLRREALRAGHNRLLAAITTMNSIAPTVVAPPLSRPSPAPAGQVPLRRASRMPLAPEDEDENFKETEAEYGGVVDSRAANIPAPPAYCESVLRSNT